MTLPPWPKIAGHDGVTTLLVFVSLVAVTQFQGLGGAVLQSTRRYSQAILFNAAGRAADAVALIVVVSLGHGFVVAALAMLGVRIIVAALQHLHVERTTPELAAGLAGRSWDCVHAMLRPSAAYMLVPISSALTVQAPVLLIGALSGPVAVAVFSVTRTLTRAGFAAINVLNSVLGPEYASRRGEGQGLRALFSLHLIVAVGFAVVFLAGCAVFGPAAIHLYSVGALQPSLWLVILLAAAVAIEIVWNTVLTALVALNLHLGLSVILFAVTLACCAAAYPATATWGSTGTAAVLVLHSTIMLAVSCALAQRTLRPAPGPILQVEA